MKVYIGEQAVLSAILLGVIVGLFVAGFGHPALFLTFLFLWVIVHLPCMWLARLIGGELELRSARRTLLFGMWLGVGLGLPVIAHVAVAPAILLEVPQLMAVSTFGCCVGPLWLGFGYWPSAWLATHITAMFISTLQCSRCGFETDAVACWSSGGYNSPFEKHILLFRNPLDGSRVGHLDCPTCGSTILL